MALIQEQFLSMLGAVNRTICAGEIHEGMETLFSALRLQRLESTNEEWGAFISACLAHPVRRLVHEDPITNRCFNKPRGYPGDAELLDYIYSAEDEDLRPMGSSPLGQEIFAYTVRAPAAKAVRARRKILAEMVDQISQKVDRPRVLSIAAGHLREACLSQAFRQRRVGEYVALDQDPKSLEEVDRCFSPFPVTTIPASVRQLLSGKVQLGQFDFVYAAGLLDYLPQPTAQLLIQTMFDMLRLGGHLLVANFLPEIRDVGYMEAFMDWKLIYRSSREMQDAAKIIPSNQIEGINLFTEESENIIFLQVTKRATVPR